MGTRLFLVRHGETDSNRTRLYMGRSAESLNERGRRQAGAVAVALAPFGINRLVSSPLARALETAEAISATTGLAPEAMEAFTEIDFGPWRGLSATEIAERYPSQWRLWRESPHLISFPGIETLASVRARVERGLSDVLGTSEGGNVVLVTHDVVIRTLLAEALRIDNSRYRSFAADNASLSILFFEGGRGRIDLLNNTSHL